MQTTTRAKLLLKKYVPSPLFTVIRSVASVTLLKIIPFIFRLRISGFKESYVRKVTYKHFSFDIEINPNNGYLDAQIHLQGLYEPHIVKEMERNIHDGDICIDIGANIGHHTVLMSKFTPHGHVYAYEPIPYIREQMRRTLAINKIKNVTLCDVALSDSEGETKLYLREGNIGGSSLVSGIDTKELSVKLTTLDKNHEGKVDFMKIDVEGYEYHVLKGAENLIKNNKPVIIFEWSPVYYRIHNNDHGRLILTFLIDLGYTLTDIENENKIISNIDEFLKEFEVGMRSQTNILATQA